MTEYKCVNCSSTKLNYSISKKSKNGESFHLYKCSNCSLEVLLPIPSEADLRRYYESEYFMKRTERGYDNYFSDELRKEISRVFQMNLSDLGFFDYEKSLEHNKKSLDIGCAAGYFVSYLSGRNWNAHGVDVSTDCVNFAKNTLNLQVELGDYLKKKYAGQFDLITLWATIEHLTNPGEFLNKVSKDISTGGRLYISTCRTGSLFKKMFGKKWRYYNFPEHVFYFNITNLISFVEKYGFKKEKYFTYGSGFGKPGTLIRKVSDFLAKYLRLGDMMVISFIREEK